MLQEVLLGKQEHRKRKRTVAFNITVILCSALVDSTYFFWARGSI